MSKRYGRIKEDLDRHAHPLPPLQIGNVVQVQNQRGKDPLKWDRSGTVVECHGNQQYSIKMDGSGRVTLRNRRFLRKIEPFIPRYVTLDSIPVQENQPAPIEVAPNETIEDNINNESTDNSGLRRSSRIRREPRRYEANLISPGGEGDIRFCKNIYPWSIDC